MKIRSLFTVPEGKPITETVFIRVVLASLCSIFLCMTCLASATWAWFTVSLENTENIIEIGAPEIKMKIGDSDFAPGQHLAVGTYEMQLTHGNAPDSLSQHADLYVTFYFMQGEQGIVEYSYVLLDREATLTVEVNQEVSISWEVTWFPPDQANPVTGDNITIPDAQQSAADTEFEHHTENSSEPTEVPPTEPSVTPVTENPTEAATEPTTTEPPTSEPTELSETTEPTSETTEETT